jgi:hypothetical protein
LRRGVWNRDASTLKRPETWGLVVYGIVTMCMES